MKEKSYKPKAIPYKVQKNGMYSFLVVGLYLVLRNWPKHETHTKNTQENNANNKDIYVM